MKITIYELLGLIKDGKAPKKIRVYGEVTDDIFTFNKNVDVYYDDDCNTLGYKYNLEVMLDSEIEIIEEVEDKEYEDIEEIIINSCGNIEKKLIDGSTIVLPTTKDEVLHNAYKINALIRNQKYILERLDKNE